MDRRSKNNSGVLQASESALSDLQSGKSDAFLSGPLVKNDVEKRLETTWVLPPIQQSTSAVVRNK